MKTFIASFLLSVSSISVGIPTALAGDCLGFTSNAEVAHCAAKMPGHGHAGKVSMGRKITKEVPPEPTPAAEPLSSDEASSNTWVGTEAERDRIVESLVNRHGH